LCSSLFEVAVVVVVTTASTAFLFLVVGGVVKVFSGENLKKEKSERESSLE
jgi:ABC-type enterochelin transport system permease subunit